MSERILEEKNQEMLVAGAYFQGKRHSTIKLQGLYRSLNWKKVHLSDKLLIRDFEKNFGRKKSRNISRRSILKFLFYLKG